MIDVSFTYSPASEITFTTWYLVISANNGAGEAFWAASCRSQQECESARAEIAPAITTLPGIETNTFCSQDPKYRELAYPSVAALTDRLRALGQRL